MIDRGLLLRLVMCLSFTAVLVVPADATVVDTDESEMACGMTVICGPCSPIRCALLHIRDIEDGVVCGGYGYLCGSGGALCGGGDVTICVSSSVE